MYIPIAVRDIHFVKSIILRFLEKKPLEENEIVAYTLRFLELSEINNLSLDCKDYKAALCSLNFGSFIQKSGVYFTLTKEGSERNKKNEFHPKLEEIFETLF